MKLERFRVRSSAFLVRAACYVGLAALALMAWGILVPTTVPVLMSMSVGQGLGGLALACYVGAVLLEVRKHEEAEEALGARRDVGAEPNRDGTASSEETDSTRSS